MLAFWLSVLPIFVRGDGLQAVPFAVFAPRDVTDSLVYRICTEASDIWESAGIVFACHRVRSEAEAGDWPLEITIDYRRASVEARGALGWITSRPTGRIVRSCPYREVDLACQRELNGVDYGWR